MEEDDTSTMAYNCGGNMGWFYKHWIFSSIKTPHFGEECRKEGQDRYDSVWSCILNPGGYHNETRPNSKSDRGLSVVGSCTGNGRSGKCSSKRMHFFLPVTYGAETISLPHLQWPVPLIPCFWNSVVKLFKKYYHKIWCFLNIKRLHETGYVHVKTWVLFQVSL